MHTSIQTCVYVYVRMHAHAHISVAAWANSVWINLSPPNNPTEMNLIVSQVTSH